MGQKEKCFLRTANKDSSVEIYTKKLEDNLYEQLKDVYGSQFKSGNGGELNYTADNAAK